MISHEALTLGAQLDEDHEPVTNGRASVCRRCGAYTDGPLGHRHSPSDLRLDKARDWLAANSCARAHSRPRVAVNA